MGSDVGDSIWDSHPEAIRLEKAAKKANARGLKAANKPGPLKIKTSGLQGRGVGAMDHMGGHGGISGVGLGGGAAHEQTR